MSKSIAPVAAPVVNNDEQLRLAAVDALLTPPAKARAARKPGRTYYAGKVLAENPNAVIDEKLAALVCAACGKLNPTESLAWLKIASQIIAGYNSVK